MDFLFIIIYKGDFASPFLSFSQQLPFLLLLLLTQDLSFFFYRVPPLIAWAIFAVGVVEHVDNREDTQVPLKSSQPVLEGKMFLGSGILFFFSKPGMTR